MTDDEIHTAAADLVARTTAAQGLPAVIDDPGALRRVAVLIAGTEREMTPAGNRGHLNNRSARSHTGRNIVDA